MLKHITWSEYFLVIGLLLVGYYALVMMKYYKRKNNDSVSAGEIETGDESLNYHGTHDDQMNTISEELFDQAQELIENLKAIIRDATLENASKETLMLRIKNQLQDYPSLNTEDFRPGISSMIVIECDNNSSVALSEREVVGLW